MSEQGSIYEDGVEKELPIPTMYQSLVSSLIGEAVLSKRRNLNKNVLSRIDRYKLGV